MVKISLEGNALKLQQILLSIFEVQDHIYYSSYDAAQDALADMSWYAALYLVWDNVEVGLNYTVSIGTRKHPNYWGIISNNILMTSTQIRDFLSLHSSGKRTFWGVK